MNYYEKYIKYKLKYYKLRQQLDNKIVNININFAKKIFNNVNEENFNKLKFTQESIYSSSRITGSKFLLKIIQKYYPNTKKLILTDGTANIGTDSINLAKYFKKINSIEFTEINFNSLENNVKIFKLENKIKIHHGDSNELVPKLKQDIIYIDAPWGGPEYKKLDKVKLYLGETEISEFYINNKNKALLFLFKVPKNYDFDNFEKITNKEYTKFPYRWNDNLKYYIIAIN